MCWWKVIFNVIQHCYLSSTTSQRPHITGPPSQHTELDQKFIRETKWILLHTHTHTHEPSENNHFCRGSSQMCSEHRDGQIHSSFNTFISWVAKCIMGRTSVLMRSYTLLSRWGNYRAWPDAEQLFIFLGFFQTAGIYNQTLTSATAPSRPLSVMIIRHILAICMMSAGLKVD